jgi:type I restriction enzyme S subunit
MNNKEKTIKTHNVKHDVEPTLRFPEFQDAPGWEEEQFGKVFSRITAKNIENNQNCLTISAQYGLVSQLDFFNKRISAKDLTGYYLLHKGDFAYNKSYSQGYPMGAIKRLNLYEKGVVSTLYICFRAKKGYSETFFEHYFDFGMINSEISKIAQEGARNHGLLNVGVREFFEKVNVRFPKIDEQQKIADCLSSVDVLIEAETQKLEAFKEHKKGLMQQLFPTEDETIPKLRFPEFSDHWDYKVLAPYLEEYTERVSAITKLPIYSSTRAGLKLQKDYYDNREIINEGEYGVVPEGFFVYRHMSDDEVFKFNINKTGSRIAVSKEYPVFRTVNLSAEFLLYKLNYSDDFKQFCIKQKKGGTRTRLYFKTLCTWETLLPSLIEQKKIAGCLCSIETVITAQSQKIDMLKEHKKGLMQQLFPTVSEVQR